MRQMLSDGLNFSSREMGHAGLVQAFLDISGQILAGQAGNVLGLIWSRKHCVHLIW